MKTPLDRISRKYTNDVEAVKCVKQFFEDKLEFILKCKQMSKPHLKTYIGLILESNNSELLFFDVQYILKTMLTEIELISKNNVCDELLDILTLTISLTKDTNFVSCSEFLKNHSEELEFAHDEIACRKLLIAEALYDIFPDLVVGTIGASIVKCVFSETKSIQNKSLQLLRHTIDDNGHSALIDQLMQQIEKNKAAKGTHCHVVLCFLIECSPLVRIYISQPSFQTYLQKQLLSNDRSLCKYALYVLRKLIEIQSNGLEQTLLSGAETTVLWETFFLIQETLDEKLSHLILPVLELLPKTEILPFNWYYVLMTQLLRHENTTVLQYGVKYAITNIVCDADSIRSDDLINEFFTSLMNGLNNTAIYAKSDFPVEKLKSFFAPIIDVAFEKCLTINWKSVPMYHIVDSIADLIFNQNRNNNEAMADQIIKLLRLVNKIPNVQIRKGIQLNIKRTVGQIFGHLSVSAFTQLVQLADINAMKEMEFLTFDHWSHEDVVAVLGHKTLGDEIKKTFFSWLEITDDDVMCLLKLMKMNEFPYFHIFEALASLYFYTLNSWLCNALKKSYEMKLEIALSMYYLLFVVNDRQHNEQILTELFKHHEVVYVVKIANQKHQIECLYQLLLEHRNRVPDIISNYLCISNLAACGTKDTLLAALDMLQNDQHLINEGHITEIVTCLRELQNAALITRFLEIMKLKGVLPMRANLYTQLIQMTVNNSHHLAIVVDHFLREDDEFLISSFKHIQNLLCYGIPLKGDQRVENDLCQRIYSNDSNWVTSPHIRFKFLRKITEFSDSPCNKTFISNLKNYFYELSADLNLSKSRYYADSQQHRTKLRIVQALAILTSCSKTWDDRLQNALFTENNQPNVTFILELMIADTVHPAHLLTLLNDVG